MGSVGLRRKVHRFPEVTDHPGSVDFWGKDSFLWCGLNLGLLDPRLGSGQSGNDLFEPFRERSRPEAKGNHFTSTIRDGVLPTFHGSPPSGTKPPDESGGLPDETVIPAHVVREPASFTRPGSPI